MEFYSAFNPPIAESCPTGDGFEPVFELQVDKKGVKDLVEVGKTNLYEKIQVNKDSCDVYSILERFDNGETNVLDKAKGQFGDFTKFPKTLAEAQQQVIDAENMFNNLPVEVRKEFNHSYTEFLASFSDGSYKSILSKFQTKPVEEKESVNQNVETSAFDHPVNMEAHNE